MNCKKVACGAIITIVIVFIAFFVLHTISMNTVYQKEIKTVNTNIQIDRPSPKVRHHVRINTPYLVAEKVGEEYKHYWVVKDLKETIIFKAERTAPKEKYIISSNGLNIRTLPLIAEDNIFTTLSFGKKVECIGTSAEGWTIVLIDEKHYFCKDEFLSEDKPKQISSKRVSYTKGEGDISLGTYTLTAYCSCTKCCGKWSGGPTASGTTPTQGRTVACNSLSFGTKISINGNIYTVEDTGNMSDNVIDIYFNSHSEALQFGRQKAEVFLVQ